MKDKAKPVNRQALYEEVWKDPVTVVAARYGLSDVGLAKLCKKLVIPLPSRGYWAKVRAGKVMGRAALPPLAEPLRPNELKPLRPRKRPVARPNERTKRPSVTASPKKRSAKTKGSHIRW